MDNSNNNQYNIEDITINDNNDNNDNNMNNNCLICLEGTIIEIKDNNKLINENTIMVNSVPFLTKTCICDYPVHYKCIEKWIESNSVCPICRNPISNVLNNKIVLKRNKELQCRQQPQQRILMNDEESLLIPDNDNMYILHHNHNHNHNSNYKKCVRVIIMVICIMICLMIINNYIYQFTV